MKTAKVKETMIHGSLRRGVSGANYKCYMSQEDFRSECARRLIELEGLREVLYLQLGSPNRLNLRKWKGREFSHDKSSILVRYFAAGDNIQLIKDRLEILNKMTRRRSGLEGLIIDVARERLSDYEWSSIISEAKARNNRPLSKEEWIEFIDSIS